MAETGPLDEATFRALVASIGWAMTPEDEADYFALLRDMEDDVRAVDAMPAYVDPALDPGGATAAAAAAHTRTYAVPARADNPFNAWSHRFELRDDDAVAAGGVLAGRTVALKDTVSVAGVPLTLGTHAYLLTRATPWPVPTVDAPIVGRLVAAGGAIRGTATCENFCMSGLSDSSASGPVDNPWLPGFSAGGSSSGSAVLVALRAVRAWRAKRGLPVGDLGEGVDCAIGGDQGGSIRLPAAYCGVYGLKPTHGLVPYTGIASLHPLADHAGPMAASLADVARLLTAIAGYDGIDPRATPHTPLPGAVPAYHALLEAAIARKQARGTWTPAAAGAGLRVGVLREALALPGVHADVVAVVRAAAAQFARLGAAVEEVSVPLHRHGSALWTAAMRGTAADVFLQNAPPDTAPSYAPPGGLRPADLAAQAWFDTMTRSSPMVVAAVLGSAYLGDPRRFPATMRSTALTHVAALRAAYTAALARVDVLLLPVTPAVGPPHGGPTTTTAAVGARARYQANLGVTDNTCPFNLTGHPALSMPGGWGAVADGSGRKLPVGIQLVGRHHDEVGVLLAGAIWEVGGLGLDKEGLDKE